MPDITLCTTEHCPLEKSCYRKTAEPKQFMQSYAEFKPSVISQQGRGVDVINCDMYLNQARYESHKEIEKIFADEKDRIVKEVSEEMIKQIHSNSAK